jgi:flagellar basal body-associated protein FliL
MLQKNKSIFVFIVLTVVIMNIFMIALLAYTLHTSRKREEEEVRTNVENLTLLLEKALVSAQGKSIYPCIRYRLI